jgi:Uncharacterized conserved protein (DUF2285)/Family of unknown function (DUF6499)
MPQVRKSGTAWERRLDDYAYTKGLDGPGWAWEFLRRNEKFLRDFRLNRAGHPTATLHVSGATVFRLRRKFVAAEKWGLSFFSNPNKTVLEVTPFWLPELLTSIAFCEAKADNDNDEEQLSLASLAGRRAVLVAKNSETVSIAHGCGNANLVVTEGSFLVGRRSLKFHHSGLESAAGHFETLKLLIQFVTETAVSNSSIALSDSKYRDYLVALDGRIAGRSYRDIAEVLYGSDRVGEYWTDDTRGLKSKVRRAVECGLALMNGGYRDLL